MSNNYSLSFNNPEGVRTSVNCAPLAYMSNYPPLTWGVEIQTTEGVCRVELNDFTRIAVNHLRAQGYLVLSPEERELLKERAK